MPRPKAPRVLPFVQSIASPLQNPRLAPTADNVARLAEKLRKIEQVSTGSLVVVDNVVDAILNQFALEGWL